MSYDLKRKDVFGLASKLGAETHVKGDELFFRWCPYCGGDGHDRDTFSVNLRTGMFKCFRASCGRQGHFVQMAKDFGYDQTCLETILGGAEPFYTGMIGSRRRVAVVKDQLVSQGYDRERLNRVHTPIGLAIGAVTPEEIAVSIIAEIIQCKRLKSDDENRSVNRSDVDFSVISALAGLIGGQASLVTVISSKGPVPRGAGAKMIVYSDGRIAGSIGGGCSEAAVIGNARGIIGTGEYMLQEVDMTGDAAEDEGMVCGGIMQVLIEDLSTI